jgi:hypothetical protein
VQAFYNDCLGSTSILGPDCSGDDLSSTACFKCLASQPTSSTWGVVILYDNDSFFTLNAGACYALIGGSAACETATQEQSECEANSCYNSGCVGTTETKFDACITSADTGACASYVSAATSACPTSITGAAACGGTATAFEDAYLAMAQEMCE